MMFLDKNTKDFILRHEVDDIAQLALKIATRKDIDVSFVLKQIAGRKTAKYKIPSWYKQTDLIYPQHLSLEQCSSEKTASYKAQLCIGNYLIDLTGGLGVDFSFMSRNIENATYVEQQSNLVEIARHNFNILGLTNVSVIQDDALSYLQSVDRMVDTIYLDPARRNRTGNKTVFIEDCTPNLLDLEYYLDKKSHRSIIKLSPMLDISQALNKLHHITELHILSINNECKELLLIKDKIHNEPFRTICINFTNNEKVESFTFTDIEESSSSVDYCESIEQYLYEPNSSILKGGAFKSIATKFKLKKLHPNSHLYTSDHLYSDFPGRQFIVKSIVSPGHKEIKELSKHLKKANISIRNYPFSVAELRKQTGLKEGGDDYIFATTLINNRKVLILCQKISCSLSDHE